MMSAGCTLAAVVLPQQILPVAASCFLRARPEAILWPPHPCHRSKAGLAYALSREDYVQNTQELLALIPSLAPRLERLNPQLLDGLVEDPSAIARKLAELKARFPSADVFRIVNRRPSLLLDDEFDEIAVAVEKLAVIFPNTDLGELIEQQPLLLVADVDVAIADLKRLMPEGLDIRWQLMNGPSLLYSVERGSKKLGPGAEF